MVIDVEKPGLRHRMEPALEPVEFHDLEERLSLLDRRYAEARTRCQRVHDAYHGACTGAQPPPEALESRLP